MGRPRSIALLLTAKPAIQPGGVRVLRIFGQAEHPRFDPFLQLVDFSFDDRVASRELFPWHPHRGLETVTHVLSGSIEQTDSRGTRSVTGPGDLHWLTTGSGVIHRQVSRATDQPLRGLELWINPPSDAETISPVARDIAAVRLPKVSPHPGLEIKVVAGEVVGVRGPLCRESADLSYLDVRLQPGADLEHPTATGHTVFAYAVEGRGAVGPRASHSLERGQLALFTTGDSIHARALDVPFRCLLLSGRPRGEPVAWSGTIAMSTREELAKAFRDLRDGTFVADRP
jgi:hypothetical protein